MLYHVYLVPGFRPHISIKKTHKNKKIIIITIDNTNKHLIVSYISTIYGTRSYNDNISEGHTKKRILLYFLFVFTVFNLIDFFMEIVRLAL